MYFVNALFISLSFAKIKCWQKKFQFRTFHFLHIKQLYMVQFVSCFRIDFLYKLTILLYRKLIIFEMDLNI